MPVHNALDRATALVRGFRRAFGLSDPTGGVERLGETLTPTVDIFGRPEWALLRGELWGGGYGFEGAGGAGVFSLVQLHNPAASGKLVVLHAVGVLQTSAVYLHDAPLATPRNTSPLDGRLAWSSTGVGLVGRVRSTTGVSALGIQVGYAILSSFYKGHFPIILSEGDSVVISPNAGANLSCGAWFVWREREMLPGEQSER